MSPRAPTPAPPTSAAGTAPDPEAGRLNRRFAENLIVLRRRAGLSQARIAARAGLHVTEISLVERGLRLPRLDTIVKLGGALEAEPCELLAGMTWRLPRDVFGRPGAYLQQEPTEVAGIDRPEPS